MGNVAYMSLFNANQNQIVGGCEVSDRRGCIEVHKIDYNISRPVDSQTGKTHGTRRHGPFSILKVIDRSSPELFQACATGKLLASARIDLYHSDYRGLEANYFSYLLENVKVISVTPLISAQTPGHDMEAVSFAFETISLIHHEGNLTAADSWETR